jgi:hypothetical protein
MVILCDSKLKQLFGCETLTAYGVSNWLVFFWLVMVFHHVLDCAFLLALQYCFFFRTCEQVLKNENRKKKV